MNNGERTNGPLRRVACPECGGMYAAKGMPQHLAFHRRWRRPPAAVPRAFVVLPPLVLEPPSTPRLWPIGTAP